jgi:hypothetical protein
VPASWYRPTIGIAIRPGRLRPERHRSRAADPPAADPDKLVPVANASGGNVDQDLVCARRRQLVHLKDLDGLPECCDPGSSHPVRRTLLAPVMRCGPPWHLVKECDSSTRAGRAFRPPLCGESGLSRRRSVWSICGGERTQTPANDGKHRRFERPAIPCNQPSVVASACRGPEMVRRGSAVRVREGASLHRC